MSRRQVEALGDELDHDGILAVQEAYGMAMERVEIAGEVDADGLLESLESRLGLAPFAESAALALDRRDSHPARRTRRRNEARAIASMRAELAAGGMGEVA